MNEIKLIASDLDGTLLLNGAQSLKSETCGLIEQLIDRGIFFVAASGRPYTNLLRLFEPVKDRIGYICENGCLAFLHDELIFRAEMDQILAKEIIQAFIDEKDCEVFISGKKTSYIQKDRKDFAKFMHEEIGFDITLIDDMFNIPEVYSKISACSESYVQNADYWKKRFGDRCTVQTGGAAWLDTMPKGVNKSTAFKKLLLHLNINPENCIMFGDNDNDKEILSMVGCPIVMKSAKKEMHAFGKFTIDTVEDVLKDILDGKFNG